MHCVRCGLDRLKEFPSETAIHLAGPENLHKPHVFLFPKVLVCLDCGFSGFSIAEPELSQLGSGMAKDKSSAAKSTASCVALER